jgi:hypothetical protein
MGCSSSEDSSTDKSLGEAPMLGPASMASAGASGGDSMHGSFGNTAPGTTPPATPLTPSGASGAGGAGASMAPASPSSSFDDGAEPEFSGAKDSAAPAMGAAVAPTTTTAPGTGTVQSGTLTAGAWDDNRNFERFSQYRSDLLQNGLEGTMPTSDSEHAAAHEESSAALAAHQKLDIALVVDTTGSMGDEIAYLQAEFLSISQAIEDAYPDAEQRWALVVYKDQGDDYVVRSVDFTADASSFRSKLGQQSAGGGGDMPEAPDAALAEMTGLAWRSGDDVARLAFWVADAPHHAEKAADMADAVRATHDLGVHIYPVASSGINELTELTMRSSAQLTGGRYLFLTDDSGVGGEHKEPTIPCYFVTRLDHAIERMVGIEMSGEYAEPATDDIIRTGGDPEDGACTLEGGDTVAIF